uniref:Filamentous hemagglutinin family N-terminal domain-containing protein n=1 Tax=Candidatus Kentrum sp. FM TaxID=2126340 RepID=A0A450SL25_9GAMM|nr:MAG: filamentous hemagglutinin family N-terminal domain-containing protein [Candidatus Kentron sp. FM]
MPFAIALLGLTGSAVIQADPDPNALPTGAQVVSGSAQIHQAGSEMTIDQGTHKLITNWQTFDIGANAGVTFNQPSTSSVALNRVSSQSPSQIFGRLSANGQVMLVNPSGIIFGQGSQVNVGGITASTLAISDADFLNANYRFSGDAMAGGILNQGTITTPSGGVVAFVAPVIRNEGTIRTPRGATAFAAGETVALDFTGDDLITVTVEKATLETLAENKGLIQADEGMVILTADAVHDVLSGAINNEGIIEAKGLTRRGGRILLTGDTVTNQAEGVLQTDTGGNIHLEGNTVTNRGSIEADESQVTLSAGPLDDPNSGDVGNEGTIEAGGPDGRIHLEGGTVTNTGTLSVAGDSAEDGARENGGQIHIDGGSVALDGDIGADGANGGVIEVRSQGSLSLTGQVHAQGLGSDGLGSDSPDTGTLDGDGGTVIYDAGGRLIENSGSVTDVSGVRDGGTILVEANTLFSSGHYLAEGETGVGGHIDLTATESVTLLSAVLDASGKTQGGLIRVGGAFQGGRSADSDTPDIDRFTDRWGILPEIRNVRETLINDSTILDVSADGATSGSEGGTAIVWSDEQTTMLGAIDATGAASGGVVEISSKRDLRRTDLLNVDIGAGGSLLLDPKNIIVGNAGAWVYAGIMGLGYTSDDEDVDVTDLLAGDRFGTSVSLSDDSKLLAVGAAGDDGASGDGSSDDSGAVYLFTFTDEEFFGGTLVETLGQDYGVDVDALEAGDNFGASVSLNGAGNLLAVGATGDDGSDNGTLESGAVYLFSFDNTATAFSDGEHVGTIGKDYRANSDPDNVNINALAADDSFGASVSLNADGDLLAVGATGDDGSNDDMLESGAVYLLSFTDTAFSAGEQVGTIGKDYPTIGPGSDTENVDVTALAASDSFGASVSLNGAGNLLAVGATGDDGTEGTGPSATTVDNTGAVYLFSFDNTTTAFSDGTQVATIGKGYTATTRNPNDVDVDALEASDSFGASVSLNSAGNLLAVGATGDDGIDYGDDSTDEDDVEVTNSGAVYLFSFTDEAFSGGDQIGTIGRGYATDSGSDPNNVDVDTLEAGDNFGASVSLNADGFRLAVGATGDDGTDEDGANVTDSSGAVYLFLDQSSFTASGDEDLVTRNSLTSWSTDYGDFEADETLIISATEITDQLDRGTGVTLQASNDITVNVEISASASGNGGELTLQAGRSLLLKGDITTDNGNLTLIANDTLANGVDDNNRYAGNAVITMANNATIDAGTGDVNITLRDGAGKTNTDSGDITLGNITANTITVVNDGTTEGSGIVLDGTLTASAANRDSIVLAGDTFVNNAGASALDVDEDNGSRWLVWSGNPANDTRGDLVYGFKQYRATYGIDAVESEAIGDGFLYTLEPTITAVLTGTVTKIYNNTIAATLTADNYTANGVVDDDIVTFNNPTSGSYDNENAGTGKTVTVNGIDEIVTQTSSVADREVTVYGYELGGDTASGAIGEITAKAITATGIVAADKVYDSDDVASLSGGAITGGSTADDDNLFIDGDNVALDISRASGTFADEHVGTHDVNITDLMLTGTDRDNYTITDASGASATISTKAITATGIAAADKVYDSDDVASLSGGEITGGSTADDDNLFIDGDNVALDISRASGTFADEHVGTHDVNITDLMLTGTDRDNYTITDASGASATISTKAITATGIAAADKVYDSDDVASLSGGEITDGSTADDDNLFIDGDNIALDISNASGIFADEHVGTHDVTITKLRVSGNDAENYTITDASGATATISTKAITASGIVAADKVYDSTNEASLSGGVITDGSAADDDNLFIDGDNIALDISNASGIFADEHVGTHDVTITKLRLSGNDAENYTITDASGASATISTKPITASGIAAANKVYDTTTDAELDLTSATLTDGAAADNDNKYYTGDVVTLVMDNVSGAFADKNVGEGKEITITGLSLDGRDADNYTLSNTTTADITAKTISVSGITASDKVYDGTTTATLTTTNAALTDGATADNDNKYYTGDDIELETSAASGSFDDAQVGTDKTVTVNNLSLSGDDAGNYLLAAYKTLADITRLC